MKRTTAWILTAAGSFIALALLLVLLLTSGGGKAEVASSPTTTVPAPSTTASTVLRLPPSTTTAPTAPPSTAPGPPITAAPGFVPLRERDALAAVAGCRSGGCRVVDRQEPVMTGAGPASFLMVLGPRTDVDDPPGFGFSPVYFVMGDGGAGARWVAGAGATWDPDPEPGLLGPDGRLYYTTLSGGAHCCEKVHVFDVAGDAPDDFGTLDGSRFSADRAWAADVNGDLWLDVTVRSNLCVFTCAGGGYLTETYHGRARGFVLASCVAEGARDLEGREHSIPLAATGDDCPIPDDALFCVDGVYDAENLACVPPSTDDPGAPAPAG